MEDREITSSTGRVELMTALENLCTAMDHLVRTAEVKLSPSIAYEPEFEQLNLEFVPSCVPADDLGSGFDQFEFALSNLADTEGVSATASNNLVKGLEEACPAEEPMFANRLVQLQNRLGGFLK